MIRIVKFALGIVGGRQHMSMPQGASLLSAREWDEDLCLWAEVDDDAPEAPRVVEVWYDDQAMPAGRRRHVGTALLPSGSVHVYESLDWTGLLPESVRRVREAASSSVWDAADALRASRGVESRAIEHLRVKGLAAR